MKTKERETYLAPVCLIAQMSETTYLMETSFPSQHKKANKASGPAASAKSTDLWDEENNGSSSFSWED
ncbi:hypothetical protein KZY67_09385 [Prevotella melaninogenica]|uniref:hypothetical protein n=1 Tax=Prevotella melaninogenica TaxID=28132 RepID=UPI001C5F6DF3|nr:hypothetical protein [Prevotella melaninogenica]MBW4742403.1 hypothetical protein [Prevotella melaninogenica]MBW4912834.1 hypothetical protein [Prevotella melaninogenica]